MLKKRILGIIGIGPRGLHALENLLTNLTDEDAYKKIQLLLFEETGNFGNGQVYDLHQVKTNWINISERILCIDKRQVIHLDNIEIPNFPSYHEWCNVANQDISKTKIDKYPPRSKIGAYLQERFQTVIEPLLEAEIAVLHKEQVEKVTLLDNSKIRIKTSSNIYESIDEVLLTIGHQPTFLSEQMSEWKKYNKENNDVQLFEDPYPIKRFLKHQKLTEKSTIGIRGFGLAMIDIVRGIAIKFGDFEIINQETRKSKYITTSSFFNSFIPFSLDGLPPSPKPINAQVDSLYQPTEAQIAIFENKIGDTLTQEKANSPLFLIEAIAPIITKIYSQLPQSFIKDKWATEIIETTIREWLKDDTYEHPLLLSLQISAAQMMKDFVGMAVGKEAVSLDFCVGQVWRHCQSSIYKQLSYNKCSEAVFAEIIHLDERMKRYAYGPPVESIQQMLALVNAGVMNLDFINDPDIELYPKGWQLKLKEKTTVVDIMINSVVDAPQIKSVNSSIIKNLLSDDLISVVHDDFGVLTNEQGYLISNVDQKVLPIALLGRLAKGTIIGVDAILECFGSRPAQWAAQAVRQVSRKNET